MAQETSQKRGRKDCKSQKTRRTAGRQYLLDSTFLELWLLTQESQDHTNQQSGVNETKAHKALAEELLAVDGCGRLPMV